MEKQAREPFAEQRLALRRQQSAPRLVERRERLLAWTKQLLRKHPLAQAVNHTLGQWSELNAFRSDGLVPIDNNLSAKGSASYSIGRIPRLWATGAGVAPRRSWPA